MAAVKVTFTLDHATIGRLQEASERLSVPKSEIVREAILEFHERIGKLSQGERARMLSVLDRYEPLMPLRPEAEVKREMAEVRRARRLGGRRSRPRART